MVDTSKSLNNKYIMPEVFVKFVLELEAFSYIRMGLSLAKQLICCLRKCSLFYFWVSCLYTFNPLPLLLKWVTTLTGTTYRNMENRKSCRTTYMVRIKESERRPFFKIFRWNNVLHDSYQAHEIVTEMEESKQKVIKCVGGNSCILKKLCYMNLKFDYS